MMGLSGRFRSALVIGGQGIRARKTRTLLSMVSLFLGVLAVVTVQAGAEIANRVLLSDVELNNGKDGSIQVYLPPHPQTLPLTLETLRGVPDAVATTRATAILGEPGVRPINPGPMPFKYATFGAPPQPDYHCDATGCHPREHQGDPPPAGQAIEISLLALTGDLREFKPFTVQAGRWLDFSGEPSLAPGLVVNLEAASGLTRYRVPAEMRVPGATANMTPRILGVVDDGAMEPRAYIRADELLTWSPVPSLDHSQGASSVELMMWPSAEPVLQTLTARLSAQGASADQLSRRVVDSREHIGGQLDLMRWIFLGMAALVLLIGVAGILNVGLATVGERIEEFALRRAVGTPRVLLAGIVLAETLIIGILTAGAAIAFAAGALHLMSRFFGDQEPMLADVTFPWQAGVAGIVAGVVAGVLGGLIPAIRAARIPIATVMRA